MKIRMAVVMGALAVALIGCHREPPDIKFAPYGEGYAAKPDFAALEHQYPLSPADLQKITPELLAQLDQEQVDQIYARLTAGPIPDGAFDGDLFFAKGMSGDRRLTEIIGGLAGRAAEFKATKLEILGRTLWKGKVFYRQDRLLRNRIEDTALLKPLIQGDLSTIEKITVNGKEAWLLFPAKLYCGQSLLDSRRESIIIDYAYSDTLPGYREHPDFLASRHGLMIRDEIRMVRPGFYLGRAYADKVFLLNFTLYNRAIAERDGPAFAKTGQAQEDCAIGTQRMVAAQWSPR